jgi:hypothetical protein
MNTVYAKTGVKVADELFIAVALLTREHPDRLSFSIPEILERAKREGLGRHRSDQSSLKQHAYEHAAANVRPGRGKYRMVYREKDNTIRLLQASDQVHPGRDGKEWPEETDIPERYVPLVRWAQERYASKRSEGKRWLHDVLALRGLGKEIWKGVNADEYVSGLRGDWR